MLIAVDATGGEYAPQEIVKGAVKAAQDYEVDIALVGRRTVLHTLANRYSKKPRLTIVEASQIIGLHESPIKAIRSKPDSSIVVGVNLVKNNVASAFVSAGNTGAVVGAALFTLGKIEGIERPALGSLLDITPSAPVFLIDAGVNSDCRPSYLVQFAQLANSYIKQVFGISSPRVGLLSNGEEEAKGNRLILESHQLLKKTDLNFIGNIEGQDISKRKADIIVTDGFTGNIVLKALEGFGDTFLDLARGVERLVIKAYRLPSRALQHNIGMDSLSRRLDYREYGGACLLGVSGNIIVAHGRSQSRAIRNAIGLAKQTAERDMVRIIKEERYGQSGRHKRRQL